MADETSKVFSISDDLEDDIFLGGYDMEGRLIPLSVSNPSQDADPYEEQNSSSISNPYSGLPPPGSFLSHKNLRELERTDSCTLLPKSSAPFILQETDISVLKSVFRDTYTQKSDIPQRAKRSSSMRDSISQYQIDEKSSSIFKVGSDNSQRVLFYSIKFGSLLGESLFKISSFDLSLCDLVTGILENYTLSQLAEQKEIDQDDHKLGNSSSINTMVSSDMFFWIDISNPTSSELEILSKIFHIHPLTIEDISSPETAHDKVDVFGDYIFITYLAIENGSPEVNSSAFQTSPFFLIVKNSCILSFHSRPNSTYSYETLHRLDNLLNSGHQYLLTTSYIAYALVDLITDDIGPIARLIEIEVDTIDELVLLLSKSEHDDMLLRLGTARRKILSLFRIVQGKPNTIKSLVRELNKKIHFFKERIFHIDRDAADYFTTKSHTQHHHNGKKSSKKEVSQELSSLNNNIRSFKEVVWSYSDVSDHISYLLSICSQSELILARTHSNHMGKISLDLATTSEGIGKLANNLTVIGVVSMPFMIIGGLFGMNVRVPGQDREDLVFFFSIVGICVAFVVVAVFLYIRGIKHF
ncbi:putative metal ion transporter [Smittium mucronatum]|uniref:Putative metal ion transporter n=1 Tax=Smittium mucronatum TaxID=133383 RepID=A0A1R0GX78_9FUNG|nr:putative metal ion transporter [Smittium mucronatum]